MDELESERELRNIDLRTSVPKIIGYYPPRRNKMNRENEFMDPESIKKSDSELDEEFKEAVEAELEKRRKIEEMQEEMEKLGYKNYAKISRNASQHTPITITEDMPQCLIDCNAINEIIRKLTDKLSPVILEIDADQSNPSTAESRKSNLRARLESILGELESLIRRIDL